MKTLRREFLAGAAGFALVGKLSSQASAATVSVALPPAAPAPVECAVGSGSGPFHAAIHAGDTALMEKLLGQDPSLLYSRDQRGTSSFMLACIAGQPKAVDLLLAKGLAMDLHEAAAAGKGDRVGEILKIDLQSMNVRDIQGYTPLHRAAAFGHSDIVWLLLSKGAQLDVKNSLAENITPMHAALSIPDSATARATAAPLLCNGVDPNAKLTDNRAPLHTATESGHVQLAEILLRKGADPEARDARGRTALDIAQARGNAALVTLLRDPKRAGRDDYSGRYLSSRTGESIHRDDANGLPQHWINVFVTMAHFDLDHTRQSYAKCQDLLMTRSLFDELAVEAATHMGREDTAGFLLDKGSPYSTATAAMFGDTARVKASLREDPKRIAERGPHDFPLILYPAFGREHLDIAELLLSSGAEVNANANGQTALHVCAKKGYVDMAAMLIARGAVKDMQSGFDDSKTPLQLAQEAKEKNEKMIALLSSKS
jgi:ankyrin repeat protein